MARFIVLCLALVAAALSGVSALTQDELNKVEAAMLVYVQECSKTFGITEEELKTAKAEKNIDGVDSCFIGCVFKQSKVVNDEGLFEPDKAIEFSKKYLSDEADQTKFAEIANECAKVNDESVSDGEKGCDRSKLLLACLAKHKHELVVSRR